MPVMTVTGPISPCDMGVTLPHEHLFIDLRNQFVEFADPERRRTSQEPVGINNLGILRRNPYAIKDNLLLDDLDTIIEEVLYFNSAGGSTIVECTSVGIHRDPQKLLQLSLSTGLNVVAGSGYYTFDTHPAEMESWSAEEIAGQIVRDLTEGMEGTSIRAGVIGEIGTSDPIRPNEWKSLLAAALAFEETGVPVYVHTFPWARTGLEVADFLLQQGVDPVRIVICHADVQPDLAYIRALLERGVFVEFDDFGKEFDIDPAETTFAAGDFAQDIERVRAVGQMVEWGYERQILITNDICLKMMLHAYGGSGYDHIVRNIVPMMRSEGLSQETIDLFIRGNPQQLFL